MSALLKFSLAIDWINERIGRVASVAVLLTALISAGNAFVRYLFANTSQELRLNPTANALAINERTAAHYLNWLETVFLVHSLPPWSRNLNNRTAGSRKWYGADTGVIAIPYADIHRSNLVEE